MLAWSLLRGFIGNSGVSFHGCRVKYWTGAIPLGQTVPDSTFYAVKYNYRGGASYTAGATGLHRCYDTDEMHPVLTETNLTGTVTKTSGSAIVAGSGTLFTTELAVGMPIRIPGGGYTIYPDIAVVASITSNTSFTAFHPMLYSASGQTATKDSSVSVARVAGYYAGAADINYRADTAGIREINIAYNNAERGISGLGSNANMDEQVFIRATSSGEWAASCVWGPAWFEVGDHVQLITWQNSGGNLDLAADLPGLPFSMFLVGT